LRWNNFFNAIFLNYFFFFFSLVIFWVFTQCFLFVFNEIRSMIILIIYQWLLYDLLYLRTWFAKTIIIAIVIVFTLCKTKIHLIFFLILISLFDHLKIIIKTFVLYLNMNVILIRHCILILIFVFSINKSWGRLWRNLCCKWIENLILDRLIMMR